MRAKEFLTESVQEVTLNDLYHDGYPDQDELLWNFVSENDFDIPFTVRKINPLDLEELIIDNYRVDELKDLFKKMQPEQKRLISDYKKDPSLSNQVIVMSGRTILDGHHRALASVLAKNPIKFIDVTEEQPERLDEVPLPSDWDEKVFSKRNTFQARLNYALERAKKMGTGSARVAFTIEYEGRPTVLKIAKNNKGLAQNEVEARILSDGYAKNLDILIPLIDYDEKNQKPVWIHMEQAQRASEKKLAKLMGADYLYDIYKLAMVIAGRDKHHTVDSYKQWLLDKTSVTPQSYEVMEDYANQMADLLNSLDIQIGDFTRAANWGIFNGKPVVIDIGLDTEVYQSMYNTRR